MTIAEFKKTARILKEAWKELETEAINDGVDIFSDEYKQAQDIIREQILSKLGFTIEEYREIKDQVAPARKQDTKKLIEETQAQVKELADRPTPEKVIEKTERVVIEKPTITQKIISNIVKEKPTIIRETKVERETYDDGEIREALSKLDSKLAEVLNQPKVEPLNRDKLRDEIGADLKEHLSYDLQENIKMLGMPDFRKLAMGLQSQIDGMANQTIDSSLYAEQGLIVILHKDGTTTAYNPSSDADGPRGTALSTAVAAAVSGDVIYLSANTFDLGSGKITLPAGVNLKGQGIGSTIIQSSGTRASIGAALVPGTGSIITDLEVQNPGGAAIGYYNVASSVPSSFTLVRVRADGRDDGLYLQSNVANTTVVDVIDSEIHADYDAVAVLGTTSGHNVTLNIHSSVITTDGLNGADGSVGVAVRQSSVGTVKLYDTVICVGDGGTNYAVENSNAALDIYLFNVTIICPKGIYDADLRITSSAKVYLSYTTWDTARLSGTASPIYLDSHVNDNTWTGVNNWMGLSNFYNPVTVGYNGTGHDVKFFGDTAGKYFEWDQSADKLNISGGLAMLDFTSAGFVKNDASGNLSGGNTIDISGDTNLGVSSPITLTGDTLGFSFSTNNTWTGTNKFSQDITLQNDEYITNSVNGDVSLVGTNTLTFDLDYNASYPAISTTGNQIRLLNYLYIGASSQTNGIRAYLSQNQDASAGGTKYNLYSEFNVGTAGTGTGYALAFDANHVFSTGTQSGSLYGFLGNVANYATGGTISGNMIGALVQIDQRSSATAITGDMRGMMTNVRSVGASRAAVTDMFGWFSLLGAGTSTVTRASHAYINNATKDTGSFTTLYGLYLEKQDVGTTNWQIYSAGGNSYFGAGNLHTDTTTGMSFGGSTSQKISLYGKTPIVQPTTAIAEAAFTENAGGTAVNVDSTFGGYTLQQVVQALQNIGALA